VVGEKKTVLKSIHKVLLDLKRIIKNFLQKLLAYLPENGRILKNFYHRMVYEKRRLFLRLRMIFQKYTPSDPEKIFWINPNRIVFHTNYFKGDNPDFKERIFDMLKDKGAVYDGNWDISTYKFSDLDVYKAFEQRIRYGKKWEETAFYKNELTAIEAGQFRWGCENRLDWNARCQYLDSLIDSIRDEGYKLAHQVTDNGGRTELFLLKKMSIEVTVNISRNGQYLFQASRHRLAIAKLLGLEKIPVKVLVRHREWQELREDLILMAKGSDWGAKIPGLLYQPAIHPDLIDIPAAHFCEGRFTAIKDNLDINYGKVLDLGSNLGYYCHKFEDLGFNCYGVENNFQISEIADKIRIAEGKQFKIISGNVLDNSVQTQILENSFDILLALNIFHHFLKSESNFNKFKKLLAALKVKMIFFEPHTHNEEQMTDSYVNFTEKEFIRFIQTHSRLNNSQYIYEANDGRHIYKIY